MTRQPGNPLENRDQRPACVEPIAVVGIGCWYPGARGPVELWENVLTRRREFRRLPKQRLPLEEYYDADPKTPDKTYGTRAAVIDGFEFDWAGRRFPERTYVGTDIAHWLALEVAISAMEDAGHMRETAPRERAAVLVGNTLTGEHTRSNAMRLRWPFVRKALLTSATAHGISSSDQQALVQTMEELYKSVFPPITDDTLAGGLSNTIAGRICNFFDMHGGGYTVDGACSSSLLAVCNAAGQLASGEIDFALAGGVDISLDTFELIGFAKTGALTAGEMKVYDREASGFLPGEGCGFVALKRLADAHAAGDEIYAVMRGWGISSDGRGGITRPNPAGQARAIRRAYQKAGYSAAELDFVEGHGTGTPVGDRAELEALATVLGEGCASVRACGVTSLKSILGHTKAAAGVAAFIKAALAVNRRVIPATAGCRAPNEVFAENGTMLYPVQYGTRCDPARVLRAGVSAMGFGGINAHVTLESSAQPLAKICPEHDERALLASHQETELFVFGADSLDQLRQQVEPIASVAGDLSKGDLLDLAKHLAETLPLSPKVRAAVIAGSPAVLQEELVQLMQTMDTCPPANGATWTSRHGTAWVGNRVSSCRIGFLLPGQGSQQLLMGRTIVERYGWARELSANVDRWVKETGGKPISQHVFPPLDRAIDGAQIAAWKQELTQTPIAQPALCLASTLYARHLERLGLRPVVVGGHSLGELTALHLAGAYNEQSLFKLAAIRGAAMEEDHGQRGAMAALRCSVAEAQRLISCAQGYVVVANVNSPQQTVISGEMSAIDQIILQAEQRGISATPLNVSQGFHSKLVARASERLSRCTEIPRIFRPNGVKVFSSIPCCNLENGVNLPEHLAAQTVSQVDFVTMAKQLGDACDLLIEVGPGNVLTNLARQILGEKGPRCLPVASQPDADRDLNVVLAATYVQGIDIRWAPLYETRPARPYVAPHERLFIDNPCERPLRSKTFDASQVEVKEIVIPSTPDTQSTIEASSQNFEADIQPNSAAAVTEDSAPDGNQLSQMLLELVHRQTGYPIDTIPLSSRLLDDLNLDSIKAAEFVAEAAHRAGLANRIDPTLFANASLEEIAQALGAAQGSPGDTPRENTPSLQPAANDASLPPLSDSHWTRNFALSYEPEELEASTKDLASANVRILAGPNDSDTARALQTALKRIGASVEVLDYKHAARRVSHNSRPVSHWIVVLPRQGRNRGLRAIHDVAARLETAAKLVGAGSEACVAFVQFGGDRVHDRHAVIAPETACATGFAQSLHHEQPRLRVRVIDVSSKLNCNEIAQSVLREICNPSQFSMAAYDNHLKRHVPTAELQQPIRYAPRDISWSSRDVILVTGGAKGVTAECALEIGRRTGAAMALVGRSSIPAGNGSGGELAETLARFAEEGVRCRYYSCDVTDTNSVKALLGLVQRDLGRVTGVIHGAGANKPRPVHAVNLEDALTEIAPKVLGAQNLFDALNEQPPKMFVSLTSIIGVTGMPGNAWYALANEALALMTRQFAAGHPGCGAISVAYSVWEEVGMGARLGSVEKLGKMGIDAIPVNEGVNRFVQLFFADPGVDQVVVAARLGGLDSWRPATLPELSDCRFLEKVEYVQPGVELRARAHLTLEKDLYVSDHVYNGSYLFPTVFGLEAMAQVAAFVTGQKFPHIIRIEDIVLQRPVVVDPERGAQIGLYAEVAEENFAGETSVRVHLRTERTGMALDHFAATLVLGQLKSGNREQWEIGELLDIEPKRDLYGDLLFQGPRFQRMEGVYSVDDLRCIMRSRNATAKEDAADSYAHGLGTRFLLGDPYFRDLLLQSVQLLIPQHDCLPVSIGSIERYQGDDRSEGPRLIRADLRSRGTTEHQADVTATDEQGNVVARLRNYRVRVLATRPGYPTAEQLASPAERDEQILEQAVTSACETFGVLSPAMAFAHSPNLHAASKQERTANTASLATRAFRRANRAGEKRNVNIRIVTLPSGKPQLHRDDARGYDLSVSHDECYHLVAVGKGKQGIDIEPIKTRSRARWMALLGVARGAILDVLISQGDSLDSAATRIWSSLEAARKVDNDADPVFEVTQRVGDVVLLEARTPTARWQVLTLPVRLTRRPERMVAIHVPVAQPTEISPTVWGSRMQDTPARDEFSP